ncbi:MAG TPA: M1 family aminopeptidase [Gemmatimonadales bacterium]|nr:M1 family aminopeptidase [Gemmatimonadales bacterium]
MRAVLVALTLVAPGFVAAQGTGYLDRYHALQNLTVVPGKVAEVNHLVVTRDVGRLTLEHGFLYYLSPIGGQTVGVVFQGKAAFSLAPTVPAEQAELQRFGGSGSMNDSVTEAILLFDDSTPQLLGRLQFTAGNPPSELTGHVKDFIASFRGENEGSYENSVIAPLLNDDTTGFFLARLEREHGGAVLFEIDPSANETVQLYRPINRARWGGSWVVVTEFPLQTPAPGSGAWWYRKRLTVPSYSVDVRLTPTGSADLDFVARATLSMRAEEPLGPWLLFRLHSKLLVDSARWVGGDTAAVFKAKDDDDLWVRAPHRLATGDSLSLTLWYHGDLIDRFLNWFFIDPGAAWYPINGQGINHANFDLTFHSPNWYPIASIGERVDSSGAAKVMTTHWVTRLPTSYATFNLGLFDNYHVQQPDAPPLDVLLSEDAHRELRRQLALQGRMIPEQTHMKENVASDVSNSLKLFTKLFGECAYSHFFVTEIPYGEGVSFPGMIDLSWSTFQETALDGFDEFFRAHEVAHQWWGNGVQPVSYRDAWLSEGMASFSALWYLQAERKHNVEYFKFLDQYRSDIHDDRDDAGPIWIGYRNSSPAARRGYDIMIYEKGAWVLHMLRIMMLDLSTMKEDRFTAMLRDFYQSYRGAPATTDDFRRVVERHMGVSMDWFFDEWVKGTAIPTYHVAWSPQAADNGRFAVRMRITQEHVPADFQMSVLVSADLGDGRFAHFRVPVRGGQSDYTSPLLPAAPRDLKFNDLNSALADVKMERW